MKKIISCLLIVFVIINMCACSNNKDSDKVEKQLLGTWISEEKGGDLYSFRLLGSKKVIWVSSMNSGGEGTIVTEEDDTYAGEWLLDGNRVIIFYKTNGHVGEEAYILDIDKNNNLKWDDDIFTKVER